MKYFIQFVDTSSRALVYLCCIFAQIFVVENLLCDLLILVLILIVHFGGTSSALGYGKSFDIPKILIFFLSFQFFERLSFLLWSNKIEPYLL